MKKTLIILLIAICCSQTAIANGLSLRECPAGPFEPAKGQYLTGTTSFTWINKDNESYIGRLWYPAQYSFGAKKAGYLPSAIYKTDLAKDFPFLDSLKTITTCALADAPILAKHRFPLLIFSPGLGLVGETGTFFFEYLASRGFIVAAVNHPGSSLFTEKTDGSYVLFQSEDYDDPTVKTLLAKTRADQLSCVLDALLNLNNTPSSILYGKLDAKHVGIFGHSIGGRSALRAASIDKRFTAAANLDGSIEAEPPYLFKNQEILMVQNDVNELIQAEIAAGTMKPEEIPEVMNKYNQYMDNLFTSPYSKKYLVYYTNTRHMNYTDLPLLLQHPEQVGSADATIVLISISNLLEDFFNEAFFYPKISLQNNFSKYLYAKLQKVKK